MIVGTHLKCMQLGCGGVQDVPSLGRIRGAPFAQRCYWFQLRPNRRRGSLPRLHLKYIAALLKHHQARRSDSRSAHYRYAEIELEPEGP